MLALHRLSVVSGWQSVTPVSRPTAPWMSLWHSWHSLWIRLLRMPAPQASPSPFSASSRNL